MASEDVLEWAETSVGLLFDANYSEREALFIQNTIDRLAAEVRELREFKAKWSKMEAERWASARKTFGIHAGSDAAMKDHSNG